MRSSSAGQKYLQSIKWQG